MLVVNPNKLNREEKKLYLTGRCEHRHAFTEHPHCFVKRRKKEVRTGFFDIEASNLKANFGILLTYCIKDETSKKIYGRQITRKELLSKTYDKNLVDDCIKDLRRFDKIVTYYGTNYDFPFIRTRALRWDLDFPEFGEIKHLDLYFTAKKKLNLHRKSLEVVTQWLGIDGKNHVDHDLWRDATFHADKKALDYIMDHNKRDVVILQKAYDRLMKYVKGTPNII